jgi:hypothetical protein
MGKGQNSGKNSYEKWLKNHLSTAKILQVGRVRGNKLNFSFGLVGFLHVYFLCALGYYYTYIKTIEQTNLH